MSLQEVYSRTETSSVPAPGLIDVSTRAGKKQARAERRRAKRERRAQESTPVSAPAVTVATPAPLPTHYAHGHWNWIPAEDSPAGDAETDFAVDSATPDTPVRALPEVQHHAIAAYPLRLAPAPAEPVRAPAQVMRIVVTAWEDDTGSLHMPSTIFTEIEPRRWKVGHPATQASAGFRLFEGLGNQAATPDTAPRPSL